MILPPDECPAYYNSYLSFVDENILMEMEEQLNTYPSFVQTIPKERETYRYASGKWTIKEVIGHITDTERIMINRALRIARQDQTPIPGFDEEAYVAAADFNAKEIKFLMEDFKVVRQSNISFLKSLDDGELRRIGIASSKAVSVRALFYIIVGHLRHHENIIKERYL